MIIVKAKDAIMTMHILGWMTVKARQYFLSWHGNMSAICLVVIIWCNFLMKPLFQNERVRNIAQILIGALLIPSGAREEQISVFPTGHAINFSKARQIQDMSSHAQKQPFRKIVLISRLEVQGKIQRQ